MKKIVFLFIAIFSLERVQAQWIQQSASSSAKLNAVHFLDASNGFAVGANTLLRTTDGGTHWNLDPVANNLALFDITFTSASIGFICGGDAMGHSMVLKTTDGGNTWTSQQLVSSYPLYHIQFANANDGFASDVHGVILTTNDGGNTWGSSGFGGMGLGYVNSMCFQSANTGFIVGDHIYGGILKTTNKGSSWTTISHPDAVTWYDLFFLNSNDAWVCGMQGSIMHSVDGGATWISQNSGTTQDLNSIFFTNTSEGYAVGANGTILKTSNGGNTWTSQSSSTTNALSSVYFATTQVGYAVGATATILKSNGATGTNQYSKETQKPVCFPNPMSKSMQLKGLTSHRYQLKISNEFGSIIFQTEGNSDELNKALAHTEIWNLGCYFIHLLDMESKEVSVEKIIKQ